MVPEELYRVEQRPREQINIRSPTCPGKVGKHRKIGWGESLPGNDLQVIPKGLAILVREWGGGS